MAKKEKSPVELVKELVIKFGQIFSTDMYIYKRKYCIPGVESKDDLLGDIVCTLPEKWENVLSELEVPDIFFIKDIKGFRAKFSDKDNTLELEDFRKGVNDPSIESMLLEDISSISKEHGDERNVWTQIPKIPDIMKTIYVDKLIYLYTIKNDDGSEEEISLAKQMFPLMTEKTADDAYIMIRKSDEFDTLYTILVDFNFSHFRVQCIYHALPTPK